MSPVHVLGKAPQPDDLAWPYLKPDDLCFRVEEGILGEVQDGNRSRGEAIARYLHEADDCTWTEVRCVARYIILYTRQDVWDGPGRDRWVDRWMADNCVRTVWHEDRKGQPDEFTHERWDTRSDGTHSAEPVPWGEGLPITVPEPPDTPPPDWRPDEYDGCWTYCKKDHPRAIRVWCLERRGDDLIPEQPR